MYKVHFTIYLSLLPFFLFCNKFHLALHTMGTVSPTLPVSGTSAEIWRKKKTIYMAIIISILDAIFSFYLCCTQVPFMGVAKKDNLLIRG